jgi:glycerol-3-phosphate dehydrogenase
VSHDLYERAFMIQSAPFMTHPLPMMIPLKHYWEIPLYWLSGKMYDFIAGSRRSVPESHFISRAEALYQFPTLNADGLKGAIVLYDGQQNDTRMNLYIALTAAQNGATIINHTQVLSLNLPPARPPADDCAIWQWIPCRGSCHRCPDVNAVSCRSRHYFLIFFPWVPRCST